MQNTRNRISPHFLFNALCSLSGSADNPGYVREKLNKISFLLRKSLENIETTAIPLSEELEIVKAYIDLQRERIPGQLDVDFAIDDSTDLQQSVPAMMIQIPVENAIKHGLLPLEQPHKQLLIDIRRNEMGHRIIIEDNGVGISSVPERVEGTGTGLKVLMQTIHLLNSKNKNKITFSIREKDSGEGVLSGTSESNVRTNSGTIVEIFIPLTYSFGF
jgi:LytS/YehU family sensor histidine kinase